MVGRKQLTRCRNECARARQRDLIPFGIVTYIFACRIYLKVWGKRLLGKFPNPKIYISVLGLKVIDKFY